MTVGRDLEALSGLRILVVEDEIFIAMMLEELLLDLGCDVVGPVSTVAAALELVAHERLDAAALDVNLGNEQVYPVADALKGAGIPFIFVTGYGSAGLSDAYRDHPTIKKPVDPGTFGADLLASLRRAATPFRKTG